MPALWSIMKILSIDQARTGAWCVYDYETKKPVVYDAFSFPLAKYTYAKAIVGICDIVEDLMVEHNISAVFIEDIQLRRNVNSFKKLAQLQGALVSMFERNEYLYGYVSPSKWQSFCKKQEIPKVIVEEEMCDEAGEEKNGEKEAPANKKQSKMLSLEFVRDHFGIETTNDNVADAICMGYYVVHCEKIEQV